jgi:F-type H+-transporting ATPase subunit b
MSGADWAAEVVAFAIVVWFLARKVVPFFRKGMAERKQAIGEQLEAGRAEKAAAERAEAEFNRAHEGLAAETARLRDDARNQSEQIAEELQERARTESARILARGQEQLAAERDTAVRQIRSDAGRLAVDLAELVVTEFLGDERHRRASVGRALEGIASDGGDAVRRREASLVRASTGEERS